MVSDSATQKSSFLNSRKIVHHFSFSSQFDILFKSYLQSSIFFFDLAGELIGVVEWGNCSPSSSILTFGKSEYKLTIVESQQVCHIKFGQHWDDQKTVGFRLNSQWNPNILIWPIGQQLILNSRIFLDFWLTLASIPGKK